jgi:site-specific DNA recombinase
LITAPDRLARKSVHQLLLLEAFARRGCEGEFLDRPISHAPHDQLLLQVRGAVAEYARALIAERMRRGRLLTQRAGLLLPWTRPPSGYRVHPDHPRDPAGVRVEAAEAAMVAQMFAVYREAGQRLYGVAKHLMALRVLTPGGHTRWNQATMRGILSNPAYTGQVYAGRLRSHPARQRRSALTPIGHQLGGRTTTPAAGWLLVAQVPPIVSQQQVAFVQTKLAHNQQLAMRHHTAYEYLLRCLVSCGRCRTACRARTESPPYGD